MEHGLEGSAQSFFPLPATSSVYIWDGISQCLNVPTDLPDYNSVSGMVGAYLLLCMVQRPGYTVGTHKSKCLLNWKHISEYSGARGKPQRGVGTEVNGENMYPI